MNEEYRYLTWSLFILFTLGVIDVNIVYEDGFEIHYYSWFDNLLEMVKRI